MSWTTKKLVQRPTLEVTYSHRTPDERMGRFGGGWQWEVGFQAGHLSRARGSMIVNLLVASVRIHWNRNGVRR